MVEYNEFWNNKFICPKCGSNKISYTDRDDYGTPCINFDWKHPSEILYILKIDIFCLHCLKEFRLFYKFEKIEEAKK